jgi:hypothetical protein
MRLLFVFRPSVERPIGHLSNHFPRRSFRAAKHVGRDGRARVRYRQVRLLAFVSHPFASRQAPASRTAPFHPADRTSRSRFRPFETHPT